MCGSTQDIEINFYLEEETIDNLKEIGDWNSNSLQQQIVQNSFTVSQNTKYNPLIRRYVNGVRGYFPG